MKKENYHFRNLVFEGGGVKGIAYAGVLQTLDKRGILKNIKRTAGTSAGAITACLVALGFSVKEIISILKNTDFNSFKDDSKFKAFNLIRVFMEYGWFKGDAFLEWLEKTISLKHNKDITFKQLYDMKGENNTKELYVVGTNLEQGKSVVFCYKKTPNVRIADAIRISMSIPLFFKSISHKGEIFVDGGLYYNYPINLFDKKVFLIDKNKFNSVNYGSKDNIFNKETLGMRVDSVEEIASNKGGIDVKKRKVDSARDFLLYVMSGLLEMANRVHLHKNDWHRTIYIENKGVKTTDFDLSGEKKKLLIDTGKESTKIYLDWFDGKYKGEKALNR